jgi:type II secretory pathway pseudopilin PulG
VRPPLSSRSFTLIELMAATAVLSSVLLLMVGMQDQMSRAWNNANRRTETGREARAALRMMATDFSALKTRRPTSGPVANMVNPILTDAPIPFVYYGGQGSAPLTIAGRLAGSSYLFGVVSRPGGELNTVGYYVARAATTNLNGLVLTNAHLFRYRSNAVNTASNLTAYFSAGSNAVSTLFRGVSPTNDEILAYNVAGLSIRALGTNVNANGANFTLAEVTNQGCRLHVTLHLYPEEVAQRLSATDWTNPVNLAKFSRSYEFRLRPLTRPAE